MKPVDKLVRIVYCLLAGLAAISASTAEAALRFDVVGAPTEVISTGRSEVLGSVNLIVRGTGNSTGTSTGGASQLSIILSGPALQIDNTVSSGIGLFWSAGFAAAAPSILSVENRDLNGRCAGFITLNFPPGASPAEGDYVRLEGVRGRIDASAGSTPGTDLFADLQSVNDPAAIIYSPDRIRVAKSLKGLTIDVVLASPLFEIRIAEGFARAFVDLDAGNDGGNSNDRTDTGGGLLGAPANSTQIGITLRDIPTGVNDVAWPVSATSPGTGASLRLLRSSFSGDSAAATYSFEAVNQVAASDQALESFVVTPGFVRGERCNIEGFSVWVSLAPAVPGAAGCAAPAPDSARPRFLELFELVTTSLSPELAVAGGEDFILTVYGSGFLPGAAVQWNGSNRTTAFVSSSRLSAQITAADIAKVGTARITVVNPAESGGAMSPPRTFSIVAPDLSLFLPRLTSGHVNPAEPAKAEFTGLALANIGGKTAELKLTAFAESGAAIAGAGIANPVRWTVHAAEQKPFVVNEILGPGFAAQSRGWLKIEGNTGQVAGFFLAFNGDLSQLDGADIAPAPMTSFVFSEIEAAGSTQLNIASPGDRPAAVEIEIVKSDGTLRAAPVRRTIPAKGVLVAALADLFQGATPDNSDYVRVTAGESVAAFEYFGRSNADFAGLNAQDAAGGGSLLYSPQYVTGGGKWRTTLSIVNLSARGGSVGVRLIGDDGTQIGGAQNIPVAAGGKVHLTDPGLFSGAGDRLVQGFLEITGGGLKLAGSVVFSDPSAGTFSAALPLVSSLSGKMVFSHIAANDTFFTGLSILNPGDNPARTVIQVFGNDGAALATKVQTVPAKGRTVMLVTEMFPELAGRSIQSGYIIVSSPIQGLAGFALFGTHNLSVLSAIPAQIVP